MTPQVIVSIIGVGLSINVAMLAYVVRVEHRLTKIETKIESLK